MFGTRVNSQIMFNEAYNHFQIITSTPKIKENNLINTNPATQNDDRVLES